MKISEFIGQLTARGQFSFTAEQARDALDASDVAARAVIRRLKQKGEIAQPVHGFYIIVPPEYRIIGCRPAEDFINDLMEYINAPYYVGLLSAAQYYGAAHHRPQQYQVITNQKRRSITCGRVKIVFVTKKDIKNVPTQKHNAPKSIIEISTPEATAMDLVLYANRCGGMDNVLIVLNDLKKKINPLKLKKLANKSNETPWIQRTGYLFDLLNEQILSDTLLELIKNKSVHQRKLAHSRLKKRFSSLDKKLCSLQKQYNKLHEKDKVNKSKKWNLIINKKLELDE